MYDQINRDPAHYQNQPCQAQLKYQPRDRKLRVLCSLYRGCICFDYWNSAPQSTPAPPTGHDDRSPHQRRDQPFNQPVTGTIRGSSSFSTATASPQPAPAPERRRSELRRRVCDLAQNINLSEQAVIIFRSAFEIRISQLGLSASFRS